MSLKRSLIQFARRIESNWTEISIQDQAVGVSAGWYIAEFTIKEVLTHTPIIQVSSGEAEKFLRRLVGAHTGDNRMLFYLPEGQLDAYDKGIQFKRLSKIPSVEGRLRALIICLRYLRDFFSPKLLIKIVDMQFRRNEELSANLLQFYNPVDYRGRINQLAKDLSAYSWLRKFWHKRFSSIKLTVLIEEESQRKALDAQVINADGVVLNPKGGYQPSEDEYIVALRAGTNLHPVAIYLIKRAILKAKNKPLLLYTDHDFIEELKAAPVFKPQPSLAYLYSYNYVYPAVVFNGSLARRRNEIKASQLEWFNDTFCYEMARSSFQGDISKVHHISEALFQLDSLKMAPTPFLGEETPWQMIKSVQAGGYNKLVASEAFSPKDAVDIVIPTRDGLNVLKPCVDSILEKTNGVKFKVIIVDNGSEKQETLDYFDSLKSDKRVSIVAYPGEFNYSAINNFAVSTSDSPYVALVNNDIEVIEADWLLQMLVWAKQPQVGIVGAKLLYSNGDIQHAGVTIGMGNAAGHIHRKEPGDSNGYQHRCVATQNMMAVTAACLLTKREIFEHVGGLDEKDFAVAYNDIDYCLKVEKLGYEVIWTPEAILYHHESISRGDDMSDQHIKRYFKELNRFQKRWKAKGFVDKYYNKHLRISDEGVYPQIPGSGKANLKYLK